MKYSEADCLRDMIASVRDAREFVGEMTYEQFVENKMAVSATIRSIEVLGEACRRLPRAWRDKHPQVPWKDIAGMRDRLIHDYGNINYSIIWHSVTELMKPLETELQSILDTL